MRYINFLQGNAQTYNKTYHEKHKAIASMHQRTVISENKRYKDIYINIPFRIG